MKRCFKCLCEKSLSEFYKHSAMADGHLGKCKACTRSDTHANRIAKIDHYRQYDRMRASQPHRRANTAEHSQAWAQQFPNRRRAQSAVARALRNGSIRAQPCWVCGAKAVAHHPDYDRPLDVVWLCQPHHKQAHALVANEPSIQKEA